MTSRYPCSSAVRVLYKTDAVPHQNFDPVESHLSGKIGQNLFAILKPDTEKRVREGLDDRPECFLFPSTVCHYFLLFRWLHYTIKNIP